MQVTRSKTHVGFVSTSGCKDKSAWSGTQSRMYNALCKEFERVSPLGPLKARYFLSLGNLIDKLFIFTFKKSFNYHHNFVTAYLLSKATGAQVRKVCPEVIFAPAGSSEISYLETDIPVCYLSDTSFGQIIKYYENFGKYSKIGNAMGNLIERRAIANSSRLIYPSAWAANYVIEKYQANPNIISIIPFGANIGIPPDRGEILPKPLARPWRLLFLGVSWKRKGGDLAFETVQLLRNQGHEVLLTVCGCIPPRVAEWMEVIPFLDKSDAKQEREFHSLMTKTHLLILPTRAEAFGVVFCEASAYGIPSIATSTGGTPAAVISGINGFLLPKDAGPSEYASLIAKVLFNEIDYQMLCESSRNHFEDCLNWSSWARSMRIVLDDLAFSS